MEHGDLDVAIRVLINIDGDLLTADFSESDDQVAANFNAVQAVTRSCLYYAVRVATDPTIPANDGCYRNLSLVTRPGSILDALPPAAVAAGNVETAQRIADVLLGALAQAAPDRVPAASQGTMNNVLIGNDEFTYYETVAGGQGGRPGRAGTVRDPHRDDQHREHPDRVPRLPLSVPGHPIHAAPGQRRHRALSRRRGDRARDRLRSGGSPVI